MSVLSTDEVRDYFRVYANLDTTGQAYVIDHLKLWAVSGLLHVVCLNQGRLELHDRECEDAELACTALSTAGFRNSSSLYHQLGPISLIEKGTSNKVEVRLNASLAHVFGHQLRFELGEAEWTNEVVPLFHKRLARCAHVHGQIPPNSSQPEALHRTEMAKRCFTSSRSRINHFEYWAEGVAAFSTKAGRRLLREIDSDLYMFLLKLVAQPEGVLKTTSFQQLQSFQKSVPLEDLIAEITTL